MVRLRQEVAMERERSRQEGEREITGHAGLEAGGDGVDGARLGAERADDLGHRREEALRGGWGGIRPAAEESVGIG